MIGALRTALEIRRREKLHRQIGAITTKLNIMAARHEPREGNKFYKLLAKKKRLERELAQPFLIDLSRHGGSPSET